jgi:hypothetical protein
LRGGDLVEGLLLHIAGEVGFGQQQHVGRLDLRPLVRRARPQNAACVQCIDQAYDAVQVQCALCLVDAQGIDDVRRVAGAARLDDQASGFEIAQNVPQLLAELELSRAA